MSWVGAAIIGGSVVSGALGMQAAGKQADAANNATQAQLQMFGQTQANLAPYMQSGTAAGNNLNYLLGNTNGAPSDSTIAQQIGMGNGSPSGPGGPGSLLKPFSMADFNASPAYQFNLEQGQNAINKASAARGDFYAPQTLQDIAKFSQGLASNEFQNAFSNYNTNLGNIWNRLSGISGAGQNAAANLGGFSGQVGGQIGNNMTGAANAQAAGMVGMGNAITGGMGNAYNAYLMNQILQKNQTGITSLSEIPGMAGANDINYAMTA